MTAHNTTGLASSAMNNPRLTGYTVAVKHKDEPVQLCGFYATRAEAQRNATSLRFGWKMQPLHVKVPTIRVREVTEQEWLDNWNSDE